MIGASAESEALRPEPETDRLASRVMLRSEVNEVISKAIPELPFEDKEVISDATLPSGVDEAIADARLEFRLDVIEAISNATLPSEVNKAISDAMP